MLISCNGSSDTIQDSGPDTTKISDSTVEKHVMGFSAFLADGSAVSDAPASRRTRAAGDGELDNDLLQKVGFGVYCWYTEGNDFSTPASATYMLMRNQRVEYDNTLAAPWHYSPSKYWPLDKNHQLTLRAYAPYVNYNLLEEVEADPKGTYVAGMPLLPVVVDKDDYKNGTQHDPLWGTGRLLQDDGEYYPKDDPDHGKRYGGLYDNIKYVNSGDMRKTNDERDGIIDWYFHHGMTSLMFTCSITKDPGCDKVTIKSITIEPLYKQGLLDISSPAKDENDKPYWYDRDVDMTVGIGADDLAATPLEINIDDPTKPTDPVPLISTGLLIIPRYYDVSTPMSVKIVYTIDSDVDEMEAIGTIPMEFFGNTKYTLGLSLTPETRGIVIDIVQSAFTPWHEGGSGQHSVYNW